MDAQVSLRVESVPPGDGDGRRGFPPYHFDGPKKPDLEHPLDGRDELSTFSHPVLCPFVIGQEDLALNPRALRLIMNKKTKTMFVLQPGGFGSGAAVFTTYEYEDYSQVDESAASRAEVQSASPARQTVENRNWTRAVVRLPEVLRRSVWSPLARRVQKLGQAA